ncbi:MAG: GDSL family lipase [Nitrospira sp.]|nr:GDSL family lipase [Nitrospira sp.]
MNILLLGDSLIEYFDWQERFPGHRCANLGAAGESVGGLLSRIGNTKNICPEADMIFIMTGINNVAMGDTGFQDLYRTILEGLFSAYPRTRIYINSLLPTAVDFISNGSIMGTNSSLKVLAEETGAEFLDVYSLFIDTKGNPIKEYLLDDGVHLSNAGYAVWAVALEKIINA